jgi:hypothetical protein
MRQEDDLVAVHTDRVAMERLRSAGHVHVGYEFWKRLGLDDIVREAGLTERACTLTCAMTLNRLVHPASEHAMPRWIRDTALEDILGIALEELADDSLYRNLDKLYPNPAYGGSRRWWSESATCSTSTPRFSSTI